MKTPRDGRTKVYRMLDALWPALDAATGATPLAFELRGKPMALPPWVILRHVVNHATYHRGQIASKLKRLASSRAYGSGLLRRDQLSPQA